MFPELLFRSFLPHCKNNNNNNNNNTCSLWLHSKMNIQPKMLHFLRTNHSSSSSCNTYLVSPSQGLLVLIHHNSFCFIELVKFEFIGWYCIFNCVLIFSAHALFYLFSFARKSLLKVIKKNSDNFNTLQSLKWVNFFSVLYIILLWCLNSLVTFYKYIFI